MSGRVGSAALARHAAGTWLGSPVFRTTGRPAAIAEVIPTFERRAFTVPTGVSGSSAENPLFDVIVREPHNPTEAEVPVGVVSKSYNLVPHREVLRIAIEALRENDIDSESVVAEVDLTQLGERMQVALTLPDEYQHDPGDGHRLGLQVRCINSVDGSTRFMAVVGWLRFVCANGMIAGTATAQLRQIHDAGLVVDDVAATVRDGLRAAKEDLSLFRRWSSTSISEDRLCHWVDTDLKKELGVKAATRAFHIVSRGHDVRLTLPFETALPSQRTVEPIQKVPGAAGGPTTAYSISQALAWLASDRRELQERTEWMLLIPALMNSLLSSS